MRYGISSKALGLLIVLGLGALPGQPSVAQEPLNIAAYQLTFEESFDSLDVSAWGREVPVGSPIRPGTAISATPVSQIRPPAFRLPPIREF